jgi:hypothetical protein
VPVLADLRPSLGSSFSRARPADATVAEAILVLELTSSLDPVIARRNPGRTIARRGAR